MAEMLEGLFRESAGRIVSILTRILGARHLELAEECAQDAMLKALEKWPFHGVPESPQAWLIQTARNRAIDVLRRDQRFVSAIPELEAAASTSTIDEELGMIFLCCHPSVPRESQVALTLKAVCGLGVKEIARAYLTKESTIAQRLVRAKRQIREEGIEFDLPQALQETDQRLDSVLEALYLLFNEGYSLRERDLAEEAIRLCRLLTSSPATAWPKCHALLSLMLLQSARDAARIDVDGSLNLLEQQDRSKWDRKRIQEGMRRLDLAANGSQLTRYHLEAGIASYHATASTWDSTNWSSIANLYEELERRYPSAVIRLNRAIAVAQCHGPQQGLQLLQGLESQLAGYAPYHAALGLFNELLLNMGPAQEQYQEAIRHAPSEIEKTHLKQRMHKMLRPIPPATTDIH